MHNSTLNLAVLLLSLAICSLHCGFVAAAKSTGSGIEYVKACDSGADDVTNQCINRIPEDVGVNSGNHACAYHEAEVKCLGLCGNTVTWKVAYMNALKRYRLVCANYIDERLAEKEEEMDTGGGESNPPPPPPPKKVKETADSSDTTKAKKKNSGIDNALEVGKAIAKKAGTPKKEATSQTPSAAAKDKPASTSAATAPKTIGVDLNQLLSNTSPTDGEKAKPQLEHKSDDSDRMKKELKNHAQAMLPSMDPEIAAAPSRAIPLTLVAALAIALSVVTTRF
ncbi:hypothetical protein GGH91_001542 [Coemansia sp. RSA 2671]|nr:hypothetical protein LPJ60_002557 [Coemansia sp. RSA 2675]KAJ2348106.1 hypothetical protein GGH91_001542 [Coemansia sp. RSA 2671]